MNQPTAKSVRKSSFFERITWFCSNADVNILEQAPLSDRIKYQGLGWSIVVSVGLTSASAGYGAFLLSKESSISSVLLIGIVVLLFGFGTFLLHRWSIARLGIGDGTSQITLSEITKSLPAIVICTLFSIVLSIPVKLLILHSEIETESYVVKVQQEQLLKQNIAEQYVVQEKKLRTAIGDAELDIISIEQQNKQRLREITSMRTDIEQTPVHLQNHLQTDVSPSWSNKIEILNRLESQLKESRKTQSRKLSVKQNSIQKDESKLFSLQQKIDAEQTIAIQEWNDRQNIWSSIRILGQIEGHIQDFLFGIVLTIIISPIFFTMMLSSSFYALTKHQSSTKHSFSKGRFL